MGFNTIEFVTGRVTGRVSKKAKKGDIRLSDNWFSDNCPALTDLTTELFNCLCLQVRQAGLRLQHNNIK